MSELPTGTPVVWQGRYDGPHHGAVEAYTTERAKTWAWVRFAWGRTLVDPARLREAGGGRDGLPG